LSQLFLINVSCHDQPGMTAELTKILARFDARVLDIGQAVIHESLSLGVLVYIDQDCERAALHKTISDHLSTPDVKLFVEPVERSEYYRWIEDQDKPRHIVTLLGRQTLAGHISKISQIVAEYGLNIGKINRLSGRVNLDDDLNFTKACVEFTLNGETPRLNDLRAALLAASNELNVDIAFQEENIFRRYRRLVVFDMDSTLIEAEVIDELAKEAGKGPEVSAITEQAMRGEINFKESFRKRVALLKGLDESVLEQVAKRLTLTEGAEKLIGTLRALGYKTAVLSGGFSYFANRLQQTLGIDYVYANDLEIKEGVVTGQVAGDIVDGEKKASLLREIARQENIKLEQVIAVGDGANDLPMLSIAGLGIAFRAKPVVRESARHAISNLGLDGILYLIGFSDRDRFDVS